MIQFLQVLAKVLLVLWLARLCYRVAKAMLKEID